MFKKCSEGTRIKEEEMTLDYYLFLVLLLYFYSLQASIAENFNIETVYVKEEIDSTETQVNFAVQLAQLICVFFARFILTIKRFSLYTFNIVVPL